MDVVPGYRVVRGPDWKWGDQDGGEGYVGTVVEVDEAAEPAAGGKTLARGVVVIWDHGSRSNYRCGLEGKFDLSVFDSGPVGVKHPNVICDCCRENGITGTRWKCVRCHDFDLCTQCYNSGKHTQEHEFSRIETSDGQSTRVPPRSSSKKIASRGIFPNAEVARGQDWLWADQDGGIGSVGKVLDVRGWDTDTFRSVVEVEWVESRKRNVYRIGHKGKIDLVCMEPASGGYYYPDHLPVLGAPLSAPYVPPPPPNPLHVQAGDKVRVQLDVEIFKMMQDGHGGWNDQMVEALQEVGTVQTILDSGDVRIRFPSNRTWTMNPDAVVKVHHIETGQFSAGDVVRILDDIARVHDLQEGHGGWVDDMALSLSLVGRVVKIFPTGDVRVSVNGRTWTYNPQCMVPAPGETPAEPSSDVGSEDIGLHLKLLSLLDNPAVIVAAAASGDASTLREFLRKHPRDVNAKAAGKAAIHCASVAGNIAVIKVLLEFSPDLEVEDEDGDKPLHLCAYGDEDEAAQLLIDSGANVNGKNHKGATPLIIAAVKGHYSVLRILANHPNIQLHEQDSDGDTALHCAVLAQKNESITILLDAGADPTLLNFRLFTPIHEAARIGFLPAVEHFIRRFPHHINLKKDDGYTALHLSSLNGHLDVVTALADLDVCILDEMTNGGQTALHLAVHQGNTSIVERLVGYGAGLNVQDSDGDTPLHIALIRETVDTLSVETPQLKKVRGNFGFEGDGVTHSSATVACFLVQEGANMYIQNKKGHAPLQVCSPEIAALITTFAGKKGGGSFHRSLRTPTSLPPGQPGLAFSHQGPQQPRGIPVGGASPHPLHSRGAEGGGGGGGGGEERGATPGGEGTAASGREPCFLCETPVDVKFEPCGHSPMCSQCAERARKCPTCKAPVKMVVKLIEICSMCKEEEVSVTLRPCSHQFCPGCSRRMRVCFECKAEIEQKEGLPPAPSPSPAPGQSADQPNCPICLTEPRDTALTCGHQLCNVCSQRVDNCPICRKFISHRIRLFL